MQLIDTTPVTEDMLRHVNETYKFAPDSQLTRTMLESGEFKLLQLSGGGAIIIWPMEDKFEKEGVQPFISGDDFLSDMHLSEMAVNAVTSYPFDLVAVRKGVPTLQFNTASDISHYFDKVKTKPSYFRGAAYNELDIRVEPCTLEYHCHIAHEKAKKYPAVGGARSDFIELAMSMIYPSAKYWRIVGVTKATGEMVFVLTMIETALRLWGGNVLITEDEKLQKRHKPYIVAHLEGVKFGRRINIPTVDYGWFFDFKEVFGVEPTYKPGIRYRKPEDCHRIWRDEDALRT